MSSFIKIDYYILFYEEFNSYSVIKKICIY